MVRLKSAWEHFTLNNSKKCVKIELAWYGSTTVMQEHLKRKKKKHPIKIPPLRVSLCDDTVRVFFPPIMTGSLYITRLITRPNTKQTND